jgi:outer membrane protein OmpA-like peptidoglycan-associated protein
MMQLKAITFISLLCGTAHADYYSAPPNAADWQISIAHSSCQLTQNIPFYGKANFTHHSGKSLQLSIREDRYKPKIVKASLTIKAPPWSHQSISSKYYLVNLDDTSSDQFYPKLSVQGDIAESMLDALSSGLSPTFIYARTSTDEKTPKTNVAISSINFIEKYHQFSNCRKDFLPSGFKRLLEKNIFYYAGNSLFNPPVSQQLKNTAKFIRHIKGSKVVITSSTSIAGKQDKKWFLKRANILVSSLRKLGISKEKIAISNKPPTANSNNNTVQLGLFGPDSLKTIYYRKGNTKLTRIQKTRLDVLAQYATEFVPNKRLIIKSHTDSKGSKKSNLKLSQKRGDVIRQYLISQGMDNNKVVVKAYGESKPVRINRFESGRSKNRRVNMSFV